MEYFITQFNVIVRLVDFVHFPQTATDEKR